MKIEFDGRVAAGLLVGVIIGAVATVAIATGPVGRIQRERNDLRTQLVISDARAERLNQSARQFATMWIESLKANGQPVAASGCIDEWDSSTCFHVSYNGEGSSPALPVAAPPNPSGGPDPRLEAVVVAMYNKVRPGLGDAIKTIIDKQQHSGN